MTKKTIKLWFVAACFYFLLLAIVGVVISILDTSQSRTAYQTFKDLIPLQIAIPAAWLSYCAQRRSAYLQQLRSLWSKLVDAVQAALQYTHSKNPTRLEYSLTLVKLCSVIDEVRSLFMNLDESDTNNGLYPFEPIKDIHGLISDLGFDEGFHSEAAAATRKKIYILWVDVRREILKEFDREPPTFPHSHWTDMEKARVYSAHQIPRRAT